MVGSAQLALSTTARPTSSALPVKGGIVLIDNDVMMLIVMNKLSKMEETLHYGQLVKKGTTSL